MRTALALACFALVMIQGGCGYRRYYFEAEERLGVAGHFESKGHFAAYYPNDITLTFPGYVVATEFGDRRALLGNDHLVMDRFVDAEGHKFVGGSVTLVIDRMAESSRLPFISHVLRYTGQPLGAGNCALYNVYQASFAVATDFCDGRKRPRIEDWKTYHSAFADSWEALDALKESLEKDAATGNYTHLVVAMMGWRTSQEEAIRNFNSIIRSIHLAAGGEFRPLFVGITWMGRWEDRWLDPLAEFLSYAPIAELADMLGLTWVGALSEEIVLPLSGKLDTTFVTHSFGSRTAATAVCIGPAIRRNPALPRQPLAGSVDRLIGFEAAFSLQRFEKDRLFFFYEDVHFANQCNHARMIVLTSSVHDLASKSIVWADFAGNYRYYRSYCEANPKPKVACASVDEHGNLQNEYDKGKKLLFLDATRLIAFKAPGTDGGAHSDIFRPETGRLIWNLMAKRAPGTAPPASAVDEASR